MEKKDSLKTIIYNAILDGIVKDEYKPNQIINEQELVKKFGYSKSPVREALITLCNDGILKNIPRFGYEIVRITREDVKDILNFRLVLEGNYLKKCYQHITLDQIKLMEEANQSCNNPSDDVWTHWEYNKNFHLLMISFAGNKYAYKQIENSMNTLKRAYAQFYWSKWNSVLPLLDIKYHVKIIDALKNLDIEDALTYLEMDLQDFCI